MKVNFQAVHDDPDITVKNAIEEKLVKMNEKHSEIIHADILMKKDNFDNKNDKIIEIIVSLPGENLFASGQDQNYETAAKKAIEGLRHQLEELKNKKKAKSRTQKI